MSEYKFIQSIYIFITSSLDTCVAAALDNIFLIYTLLSSLSAPEHWIDSAQPDILFLQETKLSSEIYNSQIFEKKYSTTTINNSVIKGSSGTLVYSNITFTNQHFCKYIDKDMEGRIIENHYRNIVIFNIYFPNGKSSEKRLKYKVSFFNRLYKYLENLKKEGKSIIICGDFNIAHKDIDLKKTKIYSNNGFSNKERAIFNKFIKAGYIDTYRYIHGDNKEAYTWWSYRSNGREKGEGWRIDYILISKDLVDKLSNAFIMDNILGSDHCPIGIEIDI